VLISQIINRDKKINVVKNINAHTNFLKQEFQYSIKLQLFND